MYKNIYSPVIDDYLTNQYCDSDGVYKRIDYQKCNYVLKLNGDKVDLFYYPNCFLTPIHSVNNEFCQDFKVDLEVERCIKRNFERDKKTNQAVRLIDSQATLSDLQLSIKRGSNRAIKKFYDYAFANKWEYFCTFTFEDERIRQSNDLLYLSWDNFRKQLRRGSSCVKALAVYEEFKKGGYHIHALLSECDLNLTPARNFDTHEFIFNSFGVQIFNCHDWKIGYNTIACIDPKSCNEQIVNYMSKYMTKCSPAPPGCKRYFKTNNLAERDTLVLYSDNIAEVLKSFNLSEYIPKCGRSEKVQYFSNYSNLREKL